jgi:hypothetical protein
MADKKVSELTSATAFSSADLMYLVQSATSKKVTLETLFANLPVNIGHKDTVYTSVGSSTVLCAGTTPTAPWFSFSSTVYDAALIDFIAEDATSSAISTMGTIRIHVQDNSIVVTNTSSTSQTGTDPINVGGASLTSSTVNITFTRTSSFNNVKVRWSAKLFKL